MRRRRRQTADGYLSKREQQIMAILNERERLTAAELTDVLPGGASNSTVRTLLRILEEKGKVRHEVEGGRFIYRPAKSQLESARPALRAIARTFFKGSIGDVVVTLVSEAGGKLSAKEWERLQEAIDKARQGGRR